MKVRCLVNQQPDPLDPQITTRHSLTPGEVYEVIGIEAGDYRVLDDVGSPSLFSPLLFEVVDPTRPPGWLTKIADGEQYSYAPELNEPGFFEDFFDGKPEAVRVFHRYLNRNLDLTRAA